MNGLHLQREKHEFLKCRLFYPYLYPPNQLNYVS